MATRIEDPELGTLIKIEEVSQLTGIAKSTIRLWRRSNYAHLAKFDSYDHPGTNAAWYRLADVEGWLLSQGKDPKGSRTLFSRKEAPNGFRVPLGERMDPRTHEGLVTLNAITKATWMSNGTQPAGMNWKLATEFEDEWREACKIALTEFVDRFKPEEDPFDLDTGSVGGIHWTPRAWDKLSPAEQSKHRMRYDFVNTLAARIIYNKNFDLGIDLSRVIKTEVI